MLIGILSDTHGHANTMAEGMHLLRSAGAEFYFHCGDVGSEEVLDQLAGEPSAFVFGNTDWDRRPLQAYADQIGVRCLDVFGTVEKGGKRFAITHGDDFRLVDRLLKEQQHDYLLLGHSHVRAAQRVGRMHVINPGALHRANPKTVALLDTETDSVRWLEVK